MQGQWVQHIPHGSVPWGLLGVPAVTPGAVTPYRACPQGLGPCPRGCAAWSPSDVAVPYGPCPMAVIWAPSDVDVLWGRAPCSCAIQPGRVAVS